MDNGQIHFGKMTREAFETAMKALVTRGLKEGRILLADLDRLLADAALTPEQTEKVHECFVQMGIDLTQDQPRSSEEREAAARAMMEEVLKDCVERLTEREAEILRMRFGLTDGRTHTLEEVAQAFGVTRERIRMVENKSVRSRRHLHRRKQIRDFYV